MPTQEEIMEQTQIPGQENGVAAIESLLQEGETQVNEAKQPTGVAAIESLLVEPEAVQQPTPVAQPMVQEAKPQSEGGFFQDTGFGRGIVSGTKEFLGSAGLALEESSLKVNDAFRWINDKVIKSDAFNQWIDEQDQRIEENISDVQEYKADVPEMQGGVGEFFGQLIPQTALFATAILSRNPLLAEAAVGTMGLSSVGSGLDTYEQYKKEKGEEVDELEKWGAGLAYGLAEFIPERIGLGFLMPKGVATKAAGKLMGQNIDQIAKTGKGMIEDLLKANPAKTTNLLKTLAQASSVEAGQEAATELMNMATDRYLTGMNISPKEFGQRLAMSAAGGAAMGGMLGPFSHFSQRAVDKARREAIGSVTVAQDEAGQTWELVNTKDGLVGFSPSGKVNKNLDPSIKDKAVTVPLEAFNRMVEGAREAGGLSDEMFREEQHRSLRQHVAQQLNTYGHTDGKLHLFVDEKDVDEATGLPREYFVISEDAGMAIMMDREGNRRIESAKDIAPKTEVLTEQEVFEQVRQRFDEQNPLEPITAESEPDTFTMQGKEYKVTSITPENLWVAAEIDENGATTGEVIQLTPEQQQAVTDELLKAPESKPDFRIVEAGGQQYKLVPTEDGNNIVDGITSKEEAEAAAQNIQTTLGEKLNIEVIRQDSGDAYTPDTYTVKLSERRAAAGEEAPPQPAYRFAGQEITRDDAMAYVAAAESAADLSDLEVEGDEELTNFVNTQFQPEYLFKGAPVSKLMAQAMIKAGKIDQLEIKNDPELEAQLRGPEEVVEEQPEVEETPQPVIDETKMAKDGQEQVPPETKRELTIDEEGNVVFVHYSQEKIDTLDPAVAAQQPSRISSPAELSAKGSVGGVVDLYTHPDQKEPGTGAVENVLKVPASKVYHLQSDPLNFYEEAERQFKAKFPDRAFDANSQAAWISKVANDHGFDVLLTDWSNGPIGKLTKPMDVTGGEFGDRPSRMPNVGDRVEVGNEEWDVTNVGEKFIDMEGPKGTRSIPTGKANQLIGRFVKMAEKDYASEEVDRVSGLDKESEDGATMNLDGTKYEGGGLVVPVDSKNTTQGELSREMIDEFIAANQDKIPENSTVKVGIYKFPNSDQVSIDLNIVVPEANRDVALEFGKRAGQESLFDLGTFENVKTGSDGKNPRTFTAEEFKEIAASLAEGKLPKAVESVESVKKQQGKDEAPAAESRGAQDLGQAEKEVNTEPTEAQKEAGNYKKGHTRVQGFDITIENPKGSTRSGTDQKGKKWSAKMNNTYGYFKRTKGKDGDQIDVFLGPNPENGKIFVVDQIDPATGKFDEHKVMMGFDSRADAIKAYKSNFSKNWQGMGPVVEVGKDAFTKWLNVEQTGKRGKRVPISFLGINRVKYPTNPANTTRLQFATQAQAAIKRVLSSVAPDTEVLLAETKEEFAKAIEGIKGANQNDKGILLTRKGKHTILINVPRMSTTTASHELSHVVFAELLQASPLHFNQFKEDVAKALEGRVRQELEDFVAGYDKVDQGEEFFAELTAMMTDTKVPRSAVQALKEVINKWTNRVFGFELFDKAAKAKDILDFFQNIADQIREGEVITEATIDTRKLGIKPGGKLSPESRAMFQAVWHGSPHEFDKFSTEHIGTGEGAQAYGWGLYFTDRKGIAASYAKMLGGSQLRFDGKSFYDIDEIEPLLSDYDFLMEVSTAKGVIEYAEGQKEGSQDRIDMFQKSLGNVEEEAAEDLKRIQAKIPLKEEEIKGIQELIDRVEGADFDETTKKFALGRFESQLEYARGELEGLKLRDNLQWHIVGLTAQHKSNIDYWKGLQDAANFIINNADKITSEGNRNLYKVKLHGDRSLDEFNYLRWDKSLPADEVDRILNTLPAEQKKYMDSTKNVIGFKEWRGSDFYSHLAATAGSPKNASLALLNAGIDGIKYPTEFTTKGDKNDTFNYVVFDENVAEIEERVKFQKAVKEKLRPAETMPTRVITSKTNKSGDLMTNPDYNVNLEVAREEAYASEKPKESSYFKNAVIISGYPLMKDAAKPTSLEEADAIYDTYVGRMKDNLLWLHGQYSEFADRAKLWYDGANVMAGESSDTYGLSVSQAAGIMAVLSPQKDWFMNVHNANRVKDIMANQQNTEFDQAMADNYINRSLEGYAVILKKKARTLGKTSKFVSLHMNKKRAELTEYIDGFKGKKLSELEPRQKAIFIRNYDEVYLDRSYNVLSPEGEVMGKAKTKTGKLAVPGWNSYSEIQKAVEIFENDDPAFISERLGLEHKVRSFYNNIADPDSDGGHVTIDTHAVAAANLLPLAGNDKITGHAMGSASNSAITGIKGTYAAIAEAYRQAAAEVGILPREMQSITWEAIRGLFPATFKTVTNKSKVLQVWKKSDNLNDLKRIQDEIKLLTGGITEPAWAEPGSPGTVEGQDGNQPGQLPIDGDGVGDTGATELRGVAEDTGGDQRADAVKFQKAPPTDSKAFKDWFGDSKVVDENGEPLVVYHGTNADFTEFERTTGQFGGGIYFTSDPEYASYFSTLYGKENANVIPVFVRIENPYVYKMWDPENENPDKTLPRRSTLERRGHDGVIGYTLNGTQEIIAFSPTQIKSATANVGTFDPENPDIRFQKSKPTPAEKQLQGFGDKVRNVFQDSMLAVRNWQESLEREGIKIRDFENAYMKENLSHGRILDKMDRFTAGQGKRLIDKVSAFVKAGNLTMDDARNYVVAKHGPERNRWFWSQAEGNVGQDFSGLTELKERVVAETKDPAEAMLLEAMPINDFADYYAQSIEGKVGKANVDALKKAVNDATDFALKEMRDSGFLSKEQYDGLKERYDYYVPLRGWSETLGKDGEAWDYASQFGKASSPMKKAKGRKSLADDPFAYILNMANTAVIAAERNKIAQATGNLVRNNRKAMEPYAEFKPVYFVKTDDVNEAGEPIIYETIDRPEQRLWDEGKVSMKVPTDYKKRKTQAQAKEHEVDFYENGQKMVLIMKDPEVARGLMGIKGTDWTTNWNRAINSPMLKHGDKTIIGAPGAATRYLSQVMTSMNPAFVLPNMARDIPLAILSEFVHGSTADAMSMIPNLRKAEGAVRRHLFGKQRSGRIDQLYDEFLRSGAATGFIHQKDVEYYRKELERGLREANKTMNPVMMASKGMRAGIDAVEKLAEWSENITRFAVYLNHRNKGVSADQAATEAKNSSVNFNRKGRLSPAINGLFAFFNAGVQAGDKYFKMWGANWPKMAAAHSWLAVQGFLAAMLMDLFGGDDEEGTRNYDKLSEYTRHNYLSVPVPGSEKVVTIPMPHVLRAFHGIGVSAYDMMTNRITAGEAVKNTIGSIPADIVPVDGSGLFDKDGNLSLKPFMPTSVKPLFELGMNENFMGYAISPEPYTPKQKDMIADTKSARKNANSAAQAITDFMYELGGGDETGYRYVEKNGELKKVPAMLDMSPHTLEHLVNSYLGGTGTFVGNVYKTSEGIFKTGLRMAEGDDFKKAIEEIQLNSTPVVRRFVRTPSGDPLMGSYYDTKNEIDRWSQLIKFYENDMSIEGVTKYIDLWTKVGMPIETFKLQYDVIDKLNDSAITMQNIGDEAGMDVLEKEKRAAMKEAVKSWEEK